MKRFNRGIANGVILGAIGAGGIVARAAPITWTFGGTITYVRDDLNLLGGQVTVGVPYSGLFTFASDTPDALPDDPTEGWYSGALVHIDGRVGPFGLAGPNGLVNEILIRDGLNDRITVRGSANFTATDMVFQVFLGTGDARTLVTDGLPSSVPLLSDFELASFRIFDPTETVPLSLIGSLESLVPEPASCVLALAASTLLLCRRRRSPARCGALLAVATVALNPFADAAPIVVLDDKSDFAEFPHTVIDFETWGDGQPLQLGEREFVNVPPEWYAESGITITARVPSEGPWIRNARGSAAFDAAHAFGGSPPNVLFTAPLVGFETGILRFDFLQPINAFGLFVINRTDGTSATLELFDETDALLGSVRLDAALRDGISLGSPYGTAYDWEYGFIGGYSRDRMIAYAMLREEFTQVDDLYLAVIAEPVTIVLTAISVVMFTWHRRRGRWHCGVCHCA
ncbi:MAG: hypothetical protein HY763_07940 [Planctomycetes bacterium]|nr:hypothetical protein [Planctomycetota bacterium]